MIVVTRVIVVFLTILSLSVILFHVGIIGPFLGNAEHAKEINDTMANLSYSYLAGLIFYL